MADNVQTSSDRLRWAALVVDYLARPLIAAELSRLPSAFPFSEQPLASDSPMAPDQIGVDAVLCQSIQGAIC